MPEQPPLREFDVTECPPVGDARDLWQSYYGTQYIEAVRDALTAQQLPSFGADTSFRVRMHFRVPSPKRYSLDQLVTLTLNALDSLFDRRSWGAIDRLVQLDARKEGASDADSAGVRIELWASED
jgi:hypothetical protein